MKKRTTKQATTLASICEDQFFQLQIRIREDTRYQYRIALRDFDKFLGRAATLSDLDDDQVTKFIRYLLDRDLAAITVRERAGRIQTLWTWLAKRRVVDQFPTFIKPDVADTMPTALTQQQLGKLFVSAARERGEIVGIPASLWWLSFLAFVWNTGERKKAVQSVKVEWLDFDHRKCTIPPEVRNGRKKWAVYDLWPETVPLLRAVIDASPGREYVWPFPYSPQSYYTRYNRILRDAGIPVNRKTKTHSLRVSHATYRQIAGGDSTRQLMHSDPATTAKHYIDPRHLPKDETKLFVPWNHTAVEQPGAAEVDAMAFIG